MLPLCYGGIDLLTLSQSNQEKFPYEFSQEQKLILVFKCLLLAQIYPITQILLYLK